MDFGLTEGVDSLLLRVLRETKKTDSLTAKSILYEAYETSFGIYDYLEQASLESVESQPDKKRPLSSVALHFAEDVSCTSKLYEMLDLFIDRNVLATTGMNWQQFLDLPHDLCERILIKCGKKQQHDSAIQQHAINSMNQAAGK